MSVVLAGGTTRGSWGCALSTTDATCSHSGCFSSPLPNSSQAATILTNFASARASGCREGMAFNASTDLVPAFIKLPSFLTFLPCKKTSDNGILAWCHASEWLSAPVDSGWAPLFRPRLVWARSRLRRGGARAARLRCGNSAWAWSVPWLPAAVKAARGARGSAWVDTSTK